MQRVVRVVVGESPVVGEHALAPRLASAGPIDVVAVFDSATHLLEKVFDHRGDLAVLDLNSLRGAGPDTVRAIKNDLRGGRVLVLCADISRPTLRAVLRAGADGYVVRVANLADLVGIVLEVARGGSFFGDEIADAFRDPDLLDDPYTVLDPTGWEFDGGTSTHASGMAGSSAGVTSREQEILRMVAVGYNSKAIAERLLISVPTVRKHRENLMRKLGLHTAAAVTAYAITHGLMARD